MFWFELKKYIQNRVFWFVALLGLLLGFFTARSELTVRADFPKQVYRDYMDILEGEHTDEKDTWIEEEQARLEEALRLHELYKQLYQNGEITLEEFQDRNEEYNYAQTQRKAFEAVLAKDAYFHETDGQVQFFYDLEILQLFQSFGADYVLILFLCIAVAAAYDLENRKDLRRMLHSLPAGRRPFWRDKLLAALFVGLLFGIADDLLHLILYGAWYRFPYMDMPARSIQQMGGIAPAMPVWAAILLLCLAKLVIAVMMTSVICLLAVLIQKFGMTVFVSVAMFGILSLVAQGLFPDISVPAWIGKLLLANRMAGSGQMVLYAAIDMGITLGVSIFLIQKQNGFR